MFALLDDRDASAQRPGSRLYTGFVREHRCNDPATLDATCAALQADQQAGLHAVLLADYEWGARLVGAGHEQLGNDASLRLLLFSRLDRLSRDEVDAWLAAQPGADQPAGVMDLQPTVERDDFRAAIARIHAAIRAGETYQVNYTYRMHGQAWGPPLALYRALRRHQPVSYGALVALPDGRWVLSCSPELFLRHQAGLLTARPMKGTSPRFQPAEGDSEAARLLSLDPKNRAENLMIVDLLRNDLGRLARIGSVKVPSLFEIESYATLLQMTSTVQAELRPGLGLAEILRASFPCGSITGAPKHRTMQLIAGLESTPRGLYCGAIGWLDAAAGDAGVGDFCLSVAIRTLTLGPEQQGRRALSLGVGAGIVLDSVADDEFDECRLKARFLTGLDPGFELFETLLLTGGHFPYRERHLARLAGSARRLDFTFERAAAEAALDELGRQLSGAGPTRVRLALAHPGRMNLRHAPLSALPAGPVGLRLALQPLPLHAPLATHKTTLRQHYDEGVAQAEAIGAFDSLFLRADGRVVEGGRSNVFARIDGRWFTPPVDDGALPGVMRGLLLDDPAWSASERSLTLEDLQRAEAIVVCNALRGVLPARLVPAQAEAAA